MALGIGWAVMTEGLEGYVDSIYFFYFSGFNKTIYIQKIGFIECIKFLLSLSGQISVKVTLQSSGFKSQNDKDFFRPWGSAKHSAQHTCFQTQLKWVRITAPEFFSEKNANVAVIIDSTLFIQLTVKAKLSCSSPSSTGQWHA